MANYQETISQMRLGIANRELLRPPYGGQLAEAVNALCADINRRLGQCLIYLRQGQAGEAVRLAKSAPDLGELMAAVDVPELREWQEVCRALGLPEEAAIDGAAWAELRRVLVNDAPFEDLLRRWRLYNLEKAPLAERVAVLRRVVAKDTSASMNLVNDLKALEAARVEELREYCRDGAQIPDLAALRAELDDFNDLDAPEIVALRQRLRGLEDAQREEGRQARFRELAQEAVAAWNAQDREAMAKISEEWESLTADGGPAPAAGAASAAAPAFAWMKAEDDREALARRHARDCAMLAKALDLGAPLEEIAALQRTAAASGAIPAELQRRCQTETSALQGARKRRRLNWSFAAVAAVLLLGAGAVYHLTTAAREGAAGKWRRAIQPLLEAGRPSEAAKVWDQLAAEDPAVAAELADLGARVRAAVESEGEEAERRKKDEEAAEREREAAAGQARQDAAARERRLEELRAELDALGKTLAAAPAKFPDAADKLESSLSAAQAQAGDTAWQNALAQMLAQVRELRGKHAAAVKDAAAKETSAQAAGLREKAVALTAALPAPAAAENNPERRAALAAQAEKLDAEREKLMKGHPDDAEVAAAADAAAAATLAAREKLALDAFADAPVTSPESVKKLYADFCRDFPGSPAGERFRAVLEKEYPVWRAAAAWRDLVERSGGIDKVPAAGLQSYLRAWPRTPFYAAAQNLYRYVAAREKSLSVDSPWGARFAAGLKDPLLAQVQELVLADGRVFYVAGPGRATAENFKFTYDVVTGPDFARDRVEQTFSKIDLADARPRVPAHAAMLEKLAAVAAAPLTRDNWEERGLDLADVVRAARDANPLVRGKMLLAILDAMLATNQWPGAMSAALAAQRDNLRAICPAGVPWTRAGDGDAAAKVRAFIDALPPYSEWKAKLAARRAELAPPPNVVGYALAIPGRLAPDGGDMVGAFLSRGKIPAAARRVFAACEASPLAEWLPVGTIDGGKASLAPAVARPGAFALLFLTD